jgi:ATP-dependent Clp protease adaptor protein ClpS
MATALTKPKKETKTKEEVNHAPRFKVLAHNDNVTTFEFVITVLIQVFKKKPDEAFEITMTVHKEGIALVGIYCQEEAEFRIDQAMSMAKTAKFPLKMTMEKE